MTRWTVSVGDDAIVIETDDKGQVIVDIPARKPLLLDRRKVEEIRLKLGAAIGDTGETVGRSS
jgi:hypothetical protein